MSFKVNRRDLFKGATAAAVGAAVLNGAGTSKLLPKNLRGVIAEAKIQEVERNYEIVDPSARFSPDDLENPQYWQTLKEGTPEFEDWAKNYPEWVPVYHERNEAKAKAPKQPPMAAAMNSVFGYTNKLLIPGKSGPVADEKIEISEEMAALKVKGFAKFLGVDYVGIAKLDPYWIFKEPHKMFEPPAESLPKSQNYIIAMGYKGDPNMYETYDSVARSSMTSKIYADHLYFANQLAAFIRGMGYDAWAHVQDQCLNVAAAADAGLGEPARWGNLIIPGAGNMVRIFSVTTELPMSVDKPIKFGVKEFCEDCKLCAELCPSGSITDGPQTVKRGIKKWWIDLRGCIVQQATYAGSCQLCHSICPWNKEDNWVHNSTEWVASHMPAFNKAFVRLDEVMYGSTLSDRLRRPPEWWAAGTNEFIDTK